jgi:hypothetical protein
MLALSGIVVVLSLIAWVVASSKDYRAIMVLSAIVILLLRHVMTGLKSREITIYSSYLKICRPRILVLPASPVRTLPLSNFSCIEIIEKETFQSGALINIFGSPQPSGFTHDRKFKFAARSGFESVLFDIPRQADGKPLRDFAYRLAGELKIEFHDKEVIDEQHEIPY